MSKEKFTPGPWVRGYGAIVITAPKEIDEPLFAWEFYTICKADPCCRSKEENEANAALIAAAPEMYYALKNLKECLESYFGKTEKSFSMCI